jgi:hypothetical protein
VYRCWQLAVGREVAVKVDSCLANEIGQQPRVSQFGR